MDSWKPTPGGFADRVLRRPGFVGEKLSFEVAIVEPEHLDVIMIHFIAGCERSDSLLEPTILAYTLAIYVLTMFFGRDWVVRLSTVLDLI